MTTPNILLCAADQLRPFELGCYGGTFVRSPNLDRLAAEGARFETAVTSYPVCMAARSCLLSGQHNRRCTGGVSNVAFPSRPGDFSMPEYPDAGRPHLKEETLPERLRAMGYATSAIGKWHIHAWPHDLGFEEYVIPRVHHCHTGQSFTENGGPEFVPPGYSVDFEAGRVEDYLRRRAQDRRPFFLYYTISPPHCPLADAPERYLRLYDPAAVPVRPNVDLDRPLQDQEHWFKVYRWDFRYYNLHLPFAERLPDGYGLRHLMAEYCGLVTWVDDTFGRMLKALDETGLADDTLVVFTSDHGDNLGSHGLVQKGSPNDESIRIPMIFRGAGLRPAAARDQVAGLTDVMPTLLDLLGAPIPSHVHGRSLAPVLRGETVALDRPHAFFETGAGAGARSPTRTCFVPYADGERRLAPAASYVVDNAADPYQLRNLAGAEPPDADAARLEEMIRAWDRQTPWLD